MPVESGGPARMFLQLTRGDPDHAACGGVSEVSRSQVAKKSVKANKGAAGVDGIGVDQLEDHIA